MEWIAMVGDGYVWNGSDPTKRSDEPENSRTVAEMKMLVKRPINPG